MADTEEFDTRAVPAPVTESPEDRFFRSVLDGDLDRAMEARPLACREWMVLADLKGLGTRTWPRGFIVRSAP